MPFNFEQENFVSLKKIILGPERINVVPFVGAGLSSYGRPDKRLPRWGELVERILQCAEEENRLDEAQLVTVRQLIEEKKYIESLDFIYTFAEKFWVDHTVESLLGIDANGISPAAISLMTITWSIIVTTNLDKMLELAHDKLVSDGYVSVRSLNVITHNNLGSLAQALSFEQAEKVTLAKIHGTVDEYKSFILNTGQYQALVQNKVYKYLLQELFRRHLLIIGFSLSDPDFDLALDHISNHYRHKNYAPYVLMPNAIFQRPESNSYLKRVRSLIKNNNLKVITYQIDYSTSTEDPWSGHKEMFECLNDLSTAWLENYKSFRFLGNAPKVDKFFVGRESYFERIDEKIFKHSGFCQVVGFGGEGKTTLVAEWVTKRKIRLKESKVKDAFFFDCYTDSPSLFFQKASQQLTGESISGNSYEQKNAVLNHIITHKTIFVFDGFEVFQDSSGAIRDQQLSLFIDAIKQSESFIIITTRLVIPDLGDPIILRRLSGKDIMNLIHKLEPDRTHPASIKRLENLMGHAQSVRFYLQIINEGTEEADESYLPEKITEDFLDTNRAANTLKKVRKGLTHDEDTLLSILCAFERPIDLNFLQRILESEIGSFELTSSAQHNRLPQLLDRLIDKQLVIALDGVPNYYLHPNVRNFYRNLSIDRSRLHRKIAEFYIQVGEPHLPIKEYPDAQIFIDICSHAAAARDWTMFDYYYQRVLMRGQEDFLCDTLGCWSEALDLTAKVFLDADTKKVPVIDPPYYLSRYARNLKHLGYGMEATKFYYTCLEECAKCQYEKSAIYINNFLTLQIYMGNLVLAKRLAPWNFALLGWIKTEQGKRNQIEHGSYSIGWLSILMGDFKTASSLFNVAENAWKGLESKRMFFFAYYALYYIEVLLIEHEDILKAETIWSKYLQLSQEYKWKETEVRCHLVSSLMERYRSIKFADNTSFLNAALAHCESARDCLQKIFAPPVEVELLIEELCIFYLYPEKDMIPFDDSTKLHELSKHITTLSWGLYKPDLTALEGLFYFTRGNYKQAEEKMIEGQKEARKLGNHFSIRSPFRPLSILSKRLNKRTDHSFKRFAGKHSSLEYKSYPVLKGDSLMQAIKGRFQKGPTE